MLAWVLLYGLTATYCLPVESLDSVEYWEQNICDARYEINTNEDLSLNCTDSNYSVHYETGFGDISVRAVYLVLFCGQDCVSSTGTWPGGTTEPGHVMVSLNGTDDFKGGLDLSCATNQTNCTVMGCHEVSPIGKPTSHYRFTPATCQIGGDADAAITEPATTDSNDATTETELGTTATTDSNDATTATTDSNDATTETELGTTATTDSNDATTETELGTDVGATKRVSTNQEPITFESGVDLPFTSNNTTTIGKVTAATAFSTVISIVILLMLFLIAAATITLLRVRVLRARKFRKHATRLYYLKSWSDFSDDFDDHFQPPVGLGLSKTLSESQPSIHCALYQYPWVQVNQCKETLNIYLESKLPPQLSKRMSNVDSPLGSLISLNSSCTMTSASKTDCAPSTDAEPDFRDHKNGGYCNEESAVKRELYAKGSQLVSGYVKDHNTVSMARETRVMSLDLLNILDSVDTDDSVNCNHQGYTNHSCSTANVIAPLCFDTDTGKSSIGHVVIPVTGEEQPSSPEVVFDFGLSTSKFGEDHTPAGITPSETMSENAVIFDFGTLPFSNLDSSDEDGDVTSFHGTASLLHEDQDFLLSQTLLYELSEVGCVAQNVAECSSDIFW